MSSDDSDSSDDPFTFQKHSFGSRRKRTYSDSSSSTSKPNTKQAATNASGVTTTATSNHAAKKQNCIELSSDDDKVSEMDDNDDSSVEEENDVSIKKKAMEQNEGYRQAQEAMEALKKAQVNKPSIDCFSVDSSSDGSSVQMISADNDINNDDSDDEIIEIMDTTGTVGTIIITTVINGDISTSHDWQLKRTDPLSKLIQIYENKHPNTEIDKIMWPEFNKQVYFDDTPIKLHMTNRVTLDLIILDDGCKIGSSNSISLKLRINGDDKRIQSYLIQPTDKFSKLFNLFLEQNTDISRDKVMFIFDGLQLSPDVTPENEDLEGDEIIDVKVK